MKYKRLWQTRRKNNEISYPVLLGNTITLSDHNNNHHIILKS